MADLTPRLEQRRAEMSHREPGRRSPREVGGGTYTGWSNTMVGQNPDKYGIPTRTKGPGVPTHEGVLGMWQLPRDHIVPAPGGTTPGGTTPGGTTPGGTTPGGTTPGGTTPGAGGATPGAGGATPGAGGATPGAGGTTPGAGGATPGAGGATPGAGGTTPGAGGATPGAGGTTPGAGGTTPGAGGTTPGAGGATPDAGGTTPARFGLADIKALYEQMQKAAGAQVDYTVEQAIRDLERKQQDAQGGFNAQRNQIDLDEAQARDAHALYARARGDRGGITAHQYDSISNTAAKNRIALAGQQQKLATDTARQIVDLRAKGEFEKADKILQLAQSQLQQMMQAQQAEDQRKFTEAGITGKYEGQDTLEAQQAAKNWATDIAMQSIQIGVLPSDDILAAAGINKDMADFLAKVYAQKEGTAMWINQILHPQPSGGGGGGYGGGLGGGYPGISYDMDTDYQALIDKALERGDYAAAAQYAAKREVKQSVMDRTNYQQLIDEALAGGNNELASYYQHLRDAKLTAQSQAASREK